MWAVIRRVLFGSPLPTWRAVHERLPKVLALPILASDALSSVAYGTEEILLILVLAGAVVLGAPFVVYISAAIALLLAIVATSYRQTVHAYPSGGGAYIVAKDNLGDKAGLTAGAALTIDYTLTVAVSIASGVAAIISAWPVLEPYRVQLCIGCIALLTLGNMRGVRESGLMFAMPTYLFIFSAFSLIAVGMYKLNTTGLTVPPPPSEVVPKMTHTLTLFLILRAFSGGCAAMTGTEAISNAVQAFRPPEPKNAAATLAMMAAILGVMFLGIGYLAWATHLIPIDPMAKGYQTVVSQLGRATFGETWFYFLMQVATMLILVLAANTSFAGFPRLASIMAHDRFLPRQLYNVGDRLVFSNGIVILALMASVLVIVFRGDTHSLIPLYAVGVFLSFTLSQAGMVRRFRRLKPPGWRRGTAISGIGSIATGIVTVVIASTKFTAGAWIVILLLPSFVYLFSRIHSHYILLGNQLRLTPADKPVPTNNTVLVLVPSIHKGVLPALEYARTLSKDVRGIHIEVDPESTPILEERWDAWGMGIPLIILESPYRSLLKPLLDYLEEAKHERENYVITVIVPEFVPVKWWHKILHNQSGFAIKFALLFRKDIIVTNVRYYLER